MNQYQQFRDLHFQQEPLVLGNAWDLTSAQQLEKAGFSALGTSSAAVAQNIGFEDGEAITFENLLHTVESIKKNTSAPLSVDIEGGYSRKAKEIAENIGRLHQLGVVGVNLEDSVVKGQRELLPLPTFSRLLSEIVNELKQRQIEMFLNVRTDTHLLQLPDAISETLRRVEAYKKSGASGIFVPGMVDLEDIKRVVAHTDLPVNVLTLPQLPAYSDLKKVGVSRISMGNFVYEMNKKRLTDAAAEMLQNRSFQDLFLI